MNNQIIEYFPTYISELSIDSIKLDNDVFIKKIDDELIELLKKSGIHGKYSPFYPLSYDILEIEDERKIYLKSNYVFAIPNIKYELSNIINFSFYIYSDFKNYLNFSIISASKKTLNSLPIV